MARKVKGLTDAQVAKGREIAEQYEFIIGREEGEYVAHSVEMWPNVGSGKTVDAAIAECKENVAMCAAAMIADGEEPPRPASEGLRTAQINIRVSSREKALMETKAKAGGFNGVADYVRAVALR